MIRKIITYPNKKLFVKSESVVKFDDELHALLDDMYETMSSSLGVGLAAIQVDVALRIFIVNLLDENEEQDKKDLIELINPILSFPDDEKIMFQEGCLSVPGYFDEVERFKRVRVEFQNRFGEKQLLNAEDVLAVVIQHENEHLDGHLFIERLNFTQKKAFEKDFKQRQKEAKRSDKALNNKNGAKKRDLKSRIKPASNSSSENLKPNSTQNASLQESEITIYNQNKQNINSQKNANLSPKNPKKRAKK